VNHQTDEIISEVTSSTEAELCTLGAMALAGDDLSLFAEIRAGLVRDSFLTVDHQLLFVAMCEMADRDQAIDLMTLREEMLRRKQFEDVGGYDTFVSLSQCPVPANGPQYAKIVREKAAWRRIIALAQGVMREAQRPHRDDSAAEAARRLADAAMGVSMDGKADSIITLGEAVDIVMDRRLHPVERRIPTGLRTIDEVIGGIPKGKFTVIGADSRVGKSQLIKQIGLNVCHLGHRFGLVSVEEDREKIAENTLSNVSGVENNRIAFGTLNPEYEWPALDLAAAQLRPMPFFIEDSAERIEDIRLAIQRLVHKHGCDVIGVDHIHLITSDGQTREREIARITKGLKLEAKRLGIALMAAAQLNRNQTGEIPTMRNLRDSGSIEFDADVILLLWRKDLTKLGEPNYHPDHVLDISIPKNKDGKMDSIKMHIEGKTQRIQDIEPPKPRHIDPFRAPRFDNVEDFI
jgi:replicative DNA helicase